MRVATFIAGLVVAGLTGVGAYAQSVAIETWDLEPFLAQGDPATGASLPPPDSTSGNRRSPDAAGPAAPSPAPPPVGGVTTAAVEVRGLLFDAAATVVESQGDATAEPELPPAATDPALATNPGAVATPTLSTVSLLGALQQQPPQGNAACPAPPLAVAPDQVALYSGNYAFCRGDFAFAVEQFQVAMLLGSAGARWKLGDMYMKGLGVEADPLQALAYFQPLVSEAVSRNYLSAGRDAVFLSGALVATSTILMTGIPETVVAPSPEQARAFLQYAAFNYNDTEAYYQYALTLLNGIGGPRYPDHAAQWLMSAAKRGHIMAAATLGYVLYFGVGIPREPQPGLAWLLTARRAISGIPGHQGWDEVRRMEEEARGSASEAELIEAATTAQRNADAWAAAGIVPR